MAAAGVGTCLAAIVSAWLRRRLGFGTCWLAAMSLCGAAGVVLALNRDVIVMGAAVLVFWFGLMLAAVCSMSLRQLVTPDVLLGRVTAAFWTTHYSLAPLGAADRGEGGDAGHRQVDDRDGEQRAGRAGHLPGGGRRRRLHPDPRPEPRGPPGRRGDLTARGPAEARPRPGRGARTDENHSVPAVRLSNGRTRGPVDHGKIEGAYPGGLGDSLRPPISPVVWSFADAHRNP
jgi:hypothetical protein